MKFMRWEWCSSDKVCDARLRLSERTGIDYEGRDLEEIVNALEEIVQIETRPLPMVGGAGFQFGKGLV